MAVVVVEESLPINSLCHLTLSTPLYITLALVFFVYLGGYQQ